MIGISALAALFFLRSYLRMKHKLAVNARTMHNWRRFFVLVGIVVAVYVIATYLLLSSASASAPYGAFRSAYASSPYLVVALNGSAPTLNQYTCVSKISNGVLNLHKKVVLASFNRGICTVGNTTATVDSCLGVYAGTNIPVVVLDERAGSGMSLYSLYGTILYVNGNDTLMNYCYVSLLTR